ncbi:hypothetical protein SUGI_0337160 [Cryptomeria japonica]|nr:hypothetical protein SUGI_0337160 [Cryptomeria japonica]
MRRRTWSFLIKVLLLLISIRIFQESEEEVSQGIEKLKLANTNNVTANSNAGTENHKKNRIQVSNTKKPLFFYVNLAKRYLQQHDEVELSALGMAIATVVTVAEILKNNGLAIEKRILTSTVDMKDETRERPIQKAKVEIILAKADKFDELMAAAAEEKNLGGEDEH